jgi:diguanylate cyclase (GGDEF)-like protein/PAS domain S-box-containing protein
MRPKGPAADVRCNLTMDKRTSPSARVLLAVAAAAVAVAIVLILLGLTGLDRLQSILLDGSMVLAGAATLCAAAGRTDRFRFVWGAVGIAQLVFAAGELNLDFVQHGLGSFPTTSDYLWLAYYPLVLLGVAFYLGDRRSLRPLVWLDGTIVVLVLVAAGFALLFGEMLSSASAPDAFVHGQLAYPLLDLGFVAFALVLGYAGRLRLGPSYYLISAAAVLLFVVDLVYFKQLASDSYTGGTLLDAGWAVTWLMMAGAAQLTLRRPVPSSTSAAGFSAMTAVITIPALLLVVRGPGHPGGTATVACAAAAILLVAIRLLITLGENQSIARDNQTIVSTAGEGIMRADPDGRLSYANPAACRMLGYSPHELIGEMGHALTHHSRANGAPYPPEECPIQTVLSGDTPVRVSDEVFWKKDGTSFPVDYTAAPIRQDGQSVGVVVVFDDVTAQRSVEQRLRHQADHDSLSGLFSRRRFVEEVEKQLRHAQRYGTSGALLMLDLDSFKFVNDSFGHDIGDDLIRRVAFLLTNRLRDSDLVGRLGGDEFAILIPEGDLDQGLELAASLRTLIKSHTDPSVEASFGVVSFDGREELVADDLVVRADIALYDAKQRGGGAVGWQGQKGARLTWVDKIRDAIESDRLVLYAQPIVDLRTDSIDGEELLVRLLEENGDVIPPAAFLPTAERFGLIQDIDRLVVRRGLELARSGRRLAINLSGRSIDDDKIIGMIEAAVADGVDPEQLTFEITETAAVRNLDHARRFSERLARIGCRLALDDFGTGLSSLSYLKHIPAQVLKIDMEFVQGVAGSSLDQYLVRTIVGIAKRLGQVTVAEGVEDAATLTALRRLGVDFAQGYHLGRPAPVDSRHAPEVTPAVRKTLVLTGKPDC